MTEPMSPTEWAMHYRKAVPPAGQAEPLPFQRGMLDRLKHLPPALMRVTSPSTPDNAWWCRWWLQPGATLDKALYLSRRPETRGMFEDFQDLPPLTGEDLAAQERRGRLVAELAQRVRSGEVTLPEPDFHPKRWLYE